MSHAYITIVNVRQEELGLDDPSDTWMQLDWDLLCFPREGTLWLPKLDSQSSKRLCLRRHCFHENDSLGGQYGSRTFLIHIRVHICRSRSIFGLKLEIECAAQCVTDALQNKPTHSHFWIIRYCVRLVAL